MLAGLEEARGCWMVDGQACGPLVIRADGLAKATAIVSHKQTAPCIQGHKPRILPSLTHFCARVLAFYEVREGVGSTGRKACNDSGDGKQSHRSVGLLSHMTLFMYRKSLVGLFAMLYRSAVRRSAGLNIMCAM